MHLSFCGTSPAVLSPYEEQVKFRINPRWIILAVLTLMVLGLFALQKAGQKELTGEQQNRFINDTRPMVDNLVEGLNNADFEVFSKDFNRKLGRQFSEADYQTLRTDLLGPAGNYQVVPGEQVELFKGYYILTLSFQFGDSSRKMKLIISPGKPYRISGISILKPADTK